jgi:hypothetical protein
MDSVTIIENNDHPRDPKIEANVDSGRSSEVPLYSKCGKWDAKTVIVIDKWS